MIKKLKFVNNLKTKAIKIEIAYSLISHKHLRTTEIYHMIDLKTPKTNIGKHMIKILNL